MARAPEDVFRFVNRPEELAGVPFFVEHFRGDAQALRSAICSFAAALPTPEREVLLQCDLGGRGADDLGKEIGLSRRHIQRCRKAVRRKFVQHVLSSSQQPAAELPVTPLNHCDRHLKRRADIAAAVLRREPAKVTAARLGISLRTFWRERSRMRQPGAAAEPKEAAAALSVLLADAEKAWCTEDYTTCSSLLHAALGVAQSIDQAQHDRYANLLFRTYMWNELIERTTGSPGVADTFFAHAQKVMQFESIDVRYKTFFALRRLKQHLRDPAGYTAAYEATLNLPQAVLQHPLADLILAEIFDAWGAEANLGPVLARASAANAPDAPPHDVARARVSALERALRPQHAAIARRCLADIRALAQPESRSHLLARAYQAFLYAQSGDKDVALSRIQTCAARFRSLNLHAELATVLYLASRICIERCAPAAAGELIDEALAHAHGRCDAKVYAQLLQYAAAAMGGRQRIRVANAFSDALRHDADLSC